MRADSLGMNRNAKRAQYSFRSHAPLETEIAESRPSAEPMGYFDLTKRSDMIGALEWWREVSASANAEELYKLSLKYLTLSDGTDAYALAERLLALAAEAGHLDAALTHGRNAVSCRFSDMFSFNSDRLLEPFADKGHGEAVQLIGRWFVTRPRFGAYYRNQAICWFGRAKELGLDTSADMKGLEARNRRMKRK